MAIELSWAGAATDTEDGLALRCRSGDSTAFDELVSRYQLRLFRRDQACYEPREVHAHIVLDGECGTLQHPLDP